MAKAVLRREAGQSLKDELKSLDESMDPRISVVVVCLMMTFYETIGYYCDLPRDPLYFIIATVIVVVWFLNHGRNYLSIKRNYEVGLRGEQKVGAYVDSLKGAGVEVFHDIQCGGFNIDHVLVSGRGIQVIESKNWRPTKSGKYIYDGRDIRSEDGKFATNRPLKQAAALAQWLQEKLKHMTNKSFEVDAVVLFPERFVEVSVKAPRIIVNNADYFVKQYATLYRAQVIDPADVALIVDRLEILSQTPSKYENLRAPRPPAYMD